MIKNFKLIIEYDGTNYSGWQRQKYDRTIQGEIEIALMKMTHQKITVIGSGRTDAGVHAFGQVANFKCDTRLTSEVFHKGLNSLLPRDIVIKCCEPADINFHARFAAKSKTYQYHILNHHLPVAIGRQYAWQIRLPLDLHGMVTAFTLFSGHP
jgi:tRNA pseudouridine38-40 synthase